MRSHFIPLPTPTPNMRSHFRLSNAAMACAVTGATAMMAGVCSGGPLGIQEFHHPTGFAFDSAYNRTYVNGWAAGQNGGFGFGAWSFDSTDATPPGQYQGISFSPEIGKAWTLLTHSGGQNGTGLANAGRAIKGGLGAGQTFETLIQNPTTYQGYYAYRGFDILFTSGPTNNPPGDNTSALRLQVFDYYNSSQYWALNDATHTIHSLTLPITGPTTGAHGVKIDLKLTSSTNYSLTMTPLNEFPFTMPGTNAVTLSGTLAEPINYVNFRLYNGASGGLTDTTNNFGISYMLVFPERFEHEGANSQGENQQ